MRVTVFSILLKLKLLNIKGVYAQYQRIGWAELKRSTNSNIYPI
jgi:hypothetical protein